MSPLSYYRKLTAFFLGLCVFVFAQSEPPATDANWSGFVANTYGPFFNGTQVSTMSATGDIFVASRVGTAIKVAHWDSRQWEFLGDRLQLLNGSNANVSDIVALSNGDVYLAGNFDTAFNENGSTTTATYIAYWEAATRLWKPVGQGTSAPATQMFVDEVNAKVYLVGPQSATNQDGTIVTLNKIGLWDIAQQTWQPIGQGVPAVGIPMSVVVDDAGNILVGGRFLEVLESDGTAIAANNIARWDGQNWFPLAGGLFAVDPPFVTSLTLDRNNRLYVGGRFNYAVNGDGSTVNGPVVSWDGSIWTGTVHPAALDIMGLETDLLNRVYSLYLDPATFVPYVVLLDGGTWQRIARPVGEFARSLSGNRRYQGTRIYLGGLFRSILAPQGEAPIENNAYWNGAWHPMLDVTLVNGGVNAFSSRANNSDLYIGGGFTEIGSIDANNLARFSGTSWDSINGGLNGPVHALAANPGIGVVVGGEFNEARNSDGSPVSALNVAYLNGSDEWMTLGGGVNGPVYAVLNRSGAVSTGRLGEIIVGGSFNTAYNPDGSSVSVNALAMWDWGTERWHPVAGDLIGNNAVVRALTPDFTDRARSFLNFFVGGRFDGAINPGGGTVNCANILMWQQVGEPDQWVALGRGTDGMVNAIAFGHSNAYRTFYGQHIWVGGDFQSSRNADGSNVRTPYLSLFDLTNNSWRALAGGTDGIVRAIAPIRSMPYQGAFVGGDFTRGYYSDGSFETLNHVGLFKLDPLQYNQQPAWNQRGINALNGSVKALISTSPCLGNAETVMAGGVFNRAGSIPVGNLARWRYRWQISLGAINIATTSRGSGGGGVRGVSTRTNCTYVNSKTDPEPYGVVFDSLGFGESVVIDSFPRFTPSQFLLYDVDRPNFPILFEDSMFVNSPAPGTVVVGGIYDTTGYAPNPDGRSRKLQTRFFEAPIDTGQPGMVTVQFLHMVTDAPALDVQLSGSSALVRGLRYGDGSGGVVLAPGSYTMEIRISGNGDLVTTVTVDLSDNADQMVILPLSGFLDPAANFDGPPLSMEIIETGQNTVGIPEGNLPGNIVRDFQLGPNFPNPFNPETTIRIEVGPLAGAQTAISTLRIYDMLGREIRTLFARHLKPGMHEVTWDGKDGRGIPVASGIYLYRLQIGNKAAQTRKMMLIK